jgi:hypothetical protein
VAGADAAKESEAQWLGVAAAGESDLTNSRGSPPFLAQMRTVHGSPLHGFFGVVGLTIDQQPRLTAVVGWIFQCCWLDQQPRHAAVVADIFQ